MNTDKFKEIDGIKCYAPDIAISKSDYPADLFHEFFKLESRNFWFKARNKMLIHLFKKYLGSSAKASVLEIGCGTGYVMQGLKAACRNYEMYGAELHLEGLKFAKKRMPDVEFIQLDATDLPFENNFNAIGAFDVLEHIDEDQRVMDSVFKALKPGSHFFITVPQYRWMWSETDDIAFHKRRYTRKELKEKLINSGFQVKYMGSFVFFLFPFMIISRFINKTKSTDTNNNAVMAELKIPSVLNTIFYFFTLIDVWLVKWGLSLPWGGSLVCVAYKEN